MRERELTIDERTVDKGTVLNFRTKENTRLKGNALKGCVGYERAG